MIDAKPAHLSREIIAKAKAFGADLAGTVNLADLKGSPSHLTARRLPDFEGEAIKAIPGKKWGVVAWPEGARSAIVIAIAHPIDKPELDWWVTRTSAGNTAGNRLLIQVVSRLTDWIEKENGLLGFKLPYHIHHGGCFMKDAAVLGGLGCIGKNNMLITPQYGARQRLRVMLTDADLPTTGGVAFDPCTDCPMPCRKACPEKAFAETIYTKDAYGIEDLPARSGVYSRTRCNQQMIVNNAAFEVIDVEGQEKPFKRIKYCRRCELACPVGA
jgi:epoxyqueuosine reductase